MGKMTGILALLGFWTLLIAQAAIIRDQVEFRYRESLPAGEQSYIVHMEKLDPSVTVSTSRTPLSRYTQLLLDVQQRAGITVNSDGSPSPSRVPIHVYERVLSGFSARLTSTEVPLLRNSNGVLGVYPDVVRSLQTTRTPEFLGLNTMLGLWPQAHFGDDVILGVFDSGVWPERESFSDVGYGPIPTRWNGTCQTGTDWNTTNCNKKLIGARYFSAGYEQATGPLNETLESRSPRDTHGHGTHTASTAAGNPVEGANLYGFANGTARGMAPKARIAVYKTCWTGGCLTSDTLAAFEFAIADGVDVISISFGTDPLPYEVSGIAIGGFAAMQRGIFISCAGGNDGPDFGTVSNAAPWLMTVAASTLDRKSGACALQLGDTFTVTGQSLWLKGNTSFPVPPNGLIYGRDAAKDNVTQATYCIPDSLNATMVKGKVVLCRRGVNGLVEKGAVVLAAGGIGMILINTVQRGDTTSADLHLLPAVHVGYTEGVRLAAYMNTTAAAGPSTFSLMCGEQLGVKPAPATAAFSSRGPNVVTPEVLKPDITAPGVQILAAWTGRVGPTRLSFDNRVVDFNMISGTSMACPHVTGVAALLKSAHPEWSPAAIKSAMMTTASIIDNMDQIIIDSYTGDQAVPWEFGSGQVMPQRALDPGLVYDMGVQDYVNFLCALKYSETTLRMFTGEAVTCPSVPIRLEDMNYPSFSAVFRQAPSLTPLSMNMTRTLTNVGNASATYRAQIVAPPGFFANVTVDPEVLTFAGINEKQRFTVQVSTVNTPDATLVNKTQTGFAYLLWFDGVTHLVESPISVTLFK